jgi:hypothetical protein
MIERDDNWGAWPFYAKQRRLVRLLDNRVCELIAVHRIPRSCKVRLYGRHYYCYVEDIGHVANRGGHDDPAERDAIEWEPIEPWRFVPVPDDDAARELRTHSAAPSKSWLTVTRTPNPRSTR